MSDDPNQRMTRQHVRVAIAEAQVYAASIAYEMAAASLDAASRARMEAEHGLRAEQQKLAEMGLT